MIPNNLNVFYKIKCFVKSIYDYTMRTLSVYY